MLARMGSVCHKPNCLDGFVQEIIDPRYLILSFDGVGWGGVNESRRSSHVVGSQIHSFDKVEE